MTKARDIAGSSLESPNRNLLYNGAMQVAQRGTSTTGITANGYYTTDRWNTLVNTLGTWTQTVESDAPNGSGFRNSVKMLCTTADAAPASADALAFRQIFEGQDLQRVAKGTPSAKALTLSFWVKSNVTGTYVAELIDVDNTRQVSAAYTISASATWEKKTITFPADTTGAFDNDNAASMTLQMWLAAGSGFTSGTLATTWASTTAANRAVGQTNLAAATNNYWQITGVQLEVGDTATDFEHLPFGVELARCQRYYEKSYNLDVAIGTNTTTGTQQGLNGIDGNQINGIRWITHKRANPTVVIYAGGGTLASLTDTNGNLAPNSGSWGALDQNQFGFRCVVGTGGLTNSRAYYYHYTASAEL